MRQDMPAPFVHVRRLDWRYRLYQFLGALAVPVAVGYILLRFMRGKSRHGFAERMGWFTSDLDNLQRGDDPLIWVHAASVGEVNAVAPVLRELRLRLPLAHVILSVITHTGHAVARKRDLGVDAVIYFPMDLPLVVERVVQRIRPDVFVMVETELWPVLLALLKSKGCGTIVVNGRISDRAYPNTLFWKPGYRWMLENVDLVCAQSEQDAERFRTLGAAPEKVSVAGNSKFDEVPVTLLPAEAARWRQEFGFAEDDIVLLAGSTHEGEEEIILSIFDHLRFSHRNLQLIIAPRHPERGEKVHALVQEHGYDVYRRSHVLQARENGQEIAPPSGPAVRVAILDTVGELASLYGCADLVIVGGSLVKGLSGHNVLEPIAQGRLALFGPYMADHRDVSAIAIREGCGIQVQSPEQLQQECERLLQSEQERRVAVERGPAMLAKYSGASRRYAEAIEYLVQQVHPQSAPEPEPVASTEQT